MTPAHPDATGPLAIFLCAAGASLIFYGVDKSRDIVGWGVGLILTGCALMAIGSFVLIDALATALAGIAPQ